MSTAQLLEIAVSAEPDQLAVASGQVRFTTPQLSGLTDGGAGVTSAFGAKHVLYGGVDGVVLASLLLATNQSRCPPATERQLQRSQ
jgi:hypothetical protein